MMFDADCSLVLETASVVDLVKVTCWLTHTQTHTLCLSLALTHTHTHTHPHTPPDTHSTQHTSHHTQTHTGLGLLTHVLQAHRPSSLVCGLGESVVRTQGYRG